MKTNIPPVLFFYLFAKTLVFSPPIENEGLYLYTTVLVFTGTKVPAERQTGMTQLSPTEAGYRVKHQKAEVSGVNLRLRAFTQSQSAV